MKQEHLTDGVSNCALLFYNMMSPNCFTSRSYQCSLKMGCFIFNLMVFIVLLHNVSVYLFVFYQLLFGYWLMQFLFLL